MVTLSADIERINQEIKEKSRFVDLLLAEVGKVIVGQRYILERILMGLLCEGHILIEGVPGLAKTLAVRTISDTIKTRFQRIQFTPDLLPADLTGTEIYNAKDGSFSIKKGPIFTNILLADEINRAPAKVQSALLEAMQERQVTIGEETLKLDDPFIVLATQNPIEQEGTYPLPEAQVDRFMLKIKITYPSKTEEEQIIRRMTGDNRQEVRPVISPEEIKAARHSIASIYMDDKIYNYIVDLVFASRDPARYGLDLGRLIEYGASTRASIYLAKAAKAYAFLQHRGYVTPDDVKSVGMDVLRHRIIPTYEAEAENIGTETIVQKIFDNIEVP
jgi:MoxR-like ATPase